MSTQILQEMHKGITKLQIDGFRSLRNITWEPGRINIVIGANGSGKSNLLRTLAMLGQGAAGNLPEMILRQGGIGQVLWDGQTKELGWKVDLSQNNLGDEIGQETATYELRLRQLGSTSAYRVERESLVYTCHNVTGDEETLNLLERHPGHATTQDSQRTKVTIMDGSISDEQPLISQVGGPFNDLNLASFSYGLLRWRIYHDVRVDQDAPLRQATVARREELIDPDGQNLIPVLHTLYTENLHFRDSIDAGMRAAFGDDFKEFLFPPAADRQIQLRLRWKSLKNPLSAADLSDGTLRFILLLTILAQPIEGTLFSNPLAGSLIAIDEPETGLHPGMFPIIAEFATEASRRTQVIFTTHSPQFLDAFHYEPPTTTVAHWVNGETRLCVLEGAELKRWLEEYSLGSLFRSGELEGMA